jgi:hypothetical protein
MRRINPEPESWIRWTPLFWCQSCHVFSFTPRRRFNHVDSTVIGSDAAMAMNQAMAS